MQLVNWQYMILYNKTVDHVIIIKVYSNNGKIIIEHIGQTIKQNKCTQFDPLTRKTENKFDFAYPLSFALYWWCPIKSWCRLITNFLLKQLTCFYRRTLAGIDCNLSAYLLGNTTARCLRNL